MVNVPLIADRLALRLVGFTAEDAGFIDNVLSDSGGGTFTNADVVDDDVNSAETSGARAALRWDVTDNVDVTLGALFQDLSTDGHGDVNIGVGDLNQVRFEDESLNNKWYQVGLTLNASLGFGDLVLSASYFDRDFHYEAILPPTNSTSIRTSSTAYPMRTTTAHPRYTTSAVTPGLRDQR